MLDKRIKLEMIHLEEKTGATAMIAPELGGWLLRYARPLPNRGLVEALHFSPETIDRYPKETYAGNPILFPLVGKNIWEGREHLYSWQDRIYEMPQHGFGRRSPWKVINQNPESVTLELTDNETTRTVYPFSFRHRVRYSLDQGRLHWQQEIENMGRVPLPFSTGFHPYFRVPLGHNSSRSQCLVKIPAASLVSSRDSWETYSENPVPYQYWQLSKAPQETVFFTNLEKQELVLVDPQGGLEVVLNFEEALQHRFVAFWSRSQDAPFYCLEPWTSPPNSFSRNQELIVLKAGEVFRAAFYMEIREIKS
jgi:galactose mutarotase-like enzyme